MGVSVLLRQFISSNEACNTAYALWRIHEQNCIFKDTKTGAVIPKETKYNLHYGEVREMFYGHHTALNTSCSVVK